MVAAKPQCYIVRRLSTFKDIRPETGMPWGGISDLEVFAKKSRDRLTNKWNLGSGNIRSRDWIRPHDVISWTVLIFFGYSHIKKQQCEFLLPYATSSGYKNLHFTIIIFVRTALSYLMLHPRKFTVVKS